MSHAAQDDVARFLAAMSEGDDQAAEHLLPLVYAELHSIADRYMRGQAHGHTLQTTALVNEACLRLLGRDDPDWKNRAHFLGVAAKAMRSVLVDHARRKQAVKRGGDRERGSLDDGAAEWPELRLDLLALDEALTAFARTYPEQTTVVELRFFGGLSVEETARVMDVSTATVKRHWRLARAWLQRALGEDDDGV